MICIVAFFAYNLSPLLFSCLPLPPCLLLSLPLPSPSSSPTGSDGCEYMFLLNGHEDLRQDERVMQLFELINTLLADNQETYKRHLQ